MDSSSKDPAEPDAVTSSGSAPPPPPPSRYESQKRRDWNTFLQYLKNHKPPLALSRCSGAHVIEFMKYLDQFGKTKVHVTGCPYYGRPNPPAPCACPLRQAWGSLDALIGRLRAAYEENGGAPDSNPFAAKAVRIYLREVRESHAKARGIPYEKKKRKRPSAAAAVATSAGAGSQEGDGGDAVAVSVAPPDSVPATTATTTTALLIQRRICSMPYYTAARLTPCPQAWMPLRLIRCQSAGDVHTVFTSSLTNS